MKRSRRLWRYPITRLINMAAVLVMLLGFAGYTSRTTTHAAGNNACQLDSAQGNIKHVIYVQFDNVHFTRDNPNVPSDLEQMPNLLNFMTNNGVLLSNHHTPLIAHTATDILTSLTGVYGDRHGVPVSNSFRYSLQAARATQAYLSPTGLPLFSTRLTRCRRPIQRITCSPQLVKMLQHPGCPTLAQAATLAL